MKFYVDTYDQSAIVTAADAEQAALKFVRNLFEKSETPNLGYVVRISEIGFDDDGEGHENDLWMSTESILKKLRVAGE